MWMDIVPVLFTSLFLMVVLSYYFLLLIPKGKPPVKKKFQSISVIVPAHNEQEYIRECLESIVAADFTKKKQIIAVDDGSIDNTYHIIKRMKVPDLKLIRTRHSGKSASINRALREADGELIAIVDGDSTIGKRSLIELAREVGRQGTAAATCVVKVKNRRRLLCLWPHIEQLYGSLVRSVMSKVNANITTPGPLSVYRRDRLMEIGGFSTEGFSEDVDVTIRLIRRGYRIGFTEETYSETNMPYRWRDFIRQRMRFARGLVNILKRHMKLNRTAIDLYTLPLFLFMYAQAVIMGLFTIYQILSGYFTWFAAYGRYFGIDVVLFFFEWASLYGFAKWIWTVASGNAPLTLLTGIGIISSLLSYPLYFYSILKYDRRLDIYHAVPLFLMAPFWWLIMLIHILTVPEMMKRSQYNIWKKNE